MAGKGKAGESDDARVERQRKWAEEHPEEARAAAAEAAAAAERNRIENAKPPGVLGQFTNYAYDAITGGAPRRLIGHIAEGDWSGAATQAANMGNTPLGQTAGIKPEGGVNTPWHDDNGDWTGPESIGGVRAGILGAYGIPAQNAPKAGGGGMAGNYDGSLAGAIARSGQLGAQADQAFAGAQGYQGLGISNAPMIDASGLVVTPRQIADQAQLEVALRGPVERYQASQIQATPDVVAQQIQAANLAPFASMTAANPGAAERINAPTLANAVGMAGPTALTAAQATSTDPTGQQINLSGQMGTQAAQLRALGTVEAEAAGTGVGGQLATSRLNSALGDIAGNQLGIAGMARGAERAGARREAMLQIGRQGMQATNQANEAALASRLGAIGQLTGAAEGARGQDIGIATQQAQLSAQAENLRAQLRTATAQGNAQEVNRLNAQFQALEQAARQQMADATNETSRLQGQMQLSALQGNQTAANDRSSLAAQLQQQANQTNATGMNAYGALGAQLQQQANLANQSTSLSAAQGNQSTAASRYATQAGLDTSANAANAGAYNLASSQDQVAINANRQAQAERMQQAEIARSGQALTAGMANQNIGFQTQQANQQAGMTVDQNRATNNQTDQQIRQSGMTGAINAGSGALGVQVDANKVAAAAAAAANKEQLDRFNALAQAAGTAYSAYQGNKNSNSGGGGLGAYGDPDSDPDLKDNVDEIAPEDLRNLANAIRVKAYNYTGDGKRRYGVMADDLKNTKLGKDLVSTGPDGNDSVDYGGLVALLSAHKANAIKESR